MDIQTLLAVAGGIVLIGNAVSVIVRWVRPAASVVKTVADHGDRLRDLEEDFKGICDRIGRIERMNRLQCGSMIALLNHMIDGNGVERMKSTRDEIQDMLTDE